MANVKLVSITKPVGELSHLSPQDLISYVARVSNPNNQLNLETAPKLIAYLIKHKHWSPFETVNATMEIQTSRAIAAQILRHRSFSFQEFSQRYQQVTEFVYYDARRQDNKNRQNSIDDMSEEDKAWFADAQTQVMLKTQSLYEEALNRKIAKEQARFLLPLSTKTTLYMSGSIRSWLHYIELRTDKSTQLEHRMLAEEAKIIFSEQFPDIAKAMGWAQDAS